MFLHRNIKQVSATWDCFHDDFGCITEGLANLDKALCQRVFCNNHSGPDSIQQLILGDQDTGTLNQVTEYFETFWT